LKEKLASQIPQTEFEGTYFYDEQNRPHWTDSVGRSNQALRRSGNLNAPNPHTDQSEADLGDHSEWRGNNHNLAILKHELARAIMIMDIEAGKLPDHLRHG